MRILSKIAIAMAVSSFVIFVVSANVYIQRLPVPVIDFMIHQTSVNWLLLVSLFILTLSLFVIALAKDVKKKFRIISLVLGLIVAFLSGAPFLMGSPSLDSERVLAIIDSVVLYIGLSAIFATAFKVRSMGVGAKALVISIVALTIGAIFGYTYGFHYFGWFFPELVARMPEGLLRIGSALAFGITTGLCVPLMYLQHKEKL